MGEKNRVIGLYAYPGDELLGTFSRLDEIDESYYLFSRSPETGARIKEHAKTRSKAFTIRIPPKGTKFVKIPFP